MSNMSLEQAHRYEKNLERGLKKKAPDHPALKKIYHSTWAAIEAYEKAIREIK